MTQMQIFTFNPEFKHQNFIENGSWNLHLTSGNTSALNNRIGFAITSYRDRYLVIFGGISLVSSSYYNDLWYFCD